MNLSEKSLDHARFESAWWENFIQETKNLNSPAVIKAAISPEKTRDYARNVLEVLREVARLKTTQFGYRVYVEGKQLGIDEMDDFFETPPLEGESLEEWSYRVFGENRFGIILNSGEKFNDALSKDVAAILAPFFHKTGYPRGGAQFTIFVGNYDKTPLGIHQDKRGESVMHFHLGPASKTMYVWDKDKYKNLLGTHGFSKKNFKELQPYSTAYHFETGDIFFMPEGTYHIGMQDGLSIGITIWRYNHTDDFLAKHLHQRIFKQIAVETTDDFHYDLSALDDTSGLDAIVEKYRLNNEYKDLSYSELLRKTYQDWRYSVHSNAGYRNTPFPREDKIDLKADDVVQIESPYKILIRESLAIEKIYIYVRGHKLEFRYLPCLIPFVQKLNDGAPHRVSDLLALLDDNWPPSIGIYILTELCRWRGINKAS